MMENKQEKQKLMVFGRSLAFIILFVAWVGNAILRVIFGYMAASEVQLLNVAVAQSTLDALVVIFLLLGVSGLIVAVGLWQMEKWGFLGTLTVIIATIVFDIWGMTIQSTAAMGLVAPVAVLIYLVANRFEFSKTSKLSVDTSAELH